MERKMSEFGGAGAAAQSGGSRPTDMRSGSASFSDTASRAKESLGAAASEASGAAGSTIQSMRKDINNLNETLTKYVSQSGKEAMKSARDMASNVAEQVGDAASDLASRGAHAASAAGAQAKSFAGELENMARRNPLGAIAGAIVIGALIGMLGRRS